jgi:GT2 family glycosyltransferase
VGGALEVALDDHGGGLFLRGWMRDPLRLVESVTLSSPFGDQPLPPERRHAFARPDVTKTFAQAPHGGNAPLPGFVAWLPEGSRVPQLQWTLTMALATGERLELTSPPGLVTPGQARDAIFTGLPLSALSAAMLDEAIVPAVRRIHAAFLAARQPPRVVSIGSPVAAPRVSVVVPLYRNLRFIRFQAAHFARDPAMAGCELIYVLDSPEQEADCEHLLRSLHAVYRLPFTLVVQAANYGFASACNAGAAVARAPHLLMLNSDVIPAARGWLPVLEAALAANPGCGAVGPKLLTDDGSVQHAGLYFMRHGPLDEWFNDHYWKGAPRGFPPLNLPREVPGVTGAAMLLERARFEAVGGFTTDYAIGDYEDSDLCLKLREAGYSIRYEPRAELHHFERQSISGHAVHDRNIATAYNRRIHQMKWEQTIAALMARPEFAADAGELV